VPSNVVLFQKTTKLGQLENMGMNNVKGLWLVLVIYNQYFFRVYLLESRFGQLLQKQPFTRGELIQQQHFNVLAKFKKKTIQDTK
jgi:hypothetical protein